MTTLGSLGLGLVAATLLALSAACSTDKDDNQGTGLGTGGSPAAGGNPAGGGIAGSTAGGVAGSGGASGSQFLPDAQAICQTILTLRCSNDQASTCASIWAGLADVVPSGCAVQQKALYDCLAVSQASDFLCSDSGFGTSKPGVCQTERDELGLCTD